MCLARENEIAHWHAAGVKTHDKRRHCARRHEGTSTIHVSNRLRRGLRHVRTRMEREFQQSNILNRLRLDGLNPGDVEKVILVVINEKSFHLRRIHPAKWLRSEEHTSELQSLTNLVC